MTITPDSIQIGWCYLTDSGSIRKVTSTDSEGMVRYRERVGAGPWSNGTRKRKRDDFAVQALREVACDWELETDQVQGIR